MSVVAFTNGRIHTMDPADPSAEIVVVDAGRIAAVGSLELLARYPHAEVRKLDGAPLVPGFIDAHNHLSVAALHPRWADLTGVTELDALRSALEAHAAAEPDAAWLRACNWNDLHEGFELSRRELDELGLDRPVVVASFSLHRAVVCSRGLSELGIGRATPDPIGGTIVRAPDGEPTGDLQERAWSDAHAASMAAYAEPDRWAEHISARARALWQDGITAVHDAACSPAAEAVYRVLASRGALPVSVLVMPHGDALLRNDGARLDGPITGEGDEWVRVGAVKLFADGGIAPAIDVHFGEIHVEFGARFGDAPEAARAAADAGFAVGIHAMGNAGVADAIAALGAVRRAHDDDRRLRIEHVGMASPAQIREAAALGLIGVVQPGFVGHVGRSAAGLDPDDAVWLPFAMARDAGIPLAGSSDDPCAPVAPLITSALGVTRRAYDGSIFGADQALPYDEWLHAYTVGAAYAGGQETERGSITVGKRADLVVLRGELDAGQPPEVAETWVGGERVFASDAPG